MGVNSREYAIRVGTSEKRRMLYVMVRVLRGEGFEWSEGKGGKKDTVKVRDLACPEHERCGRNE